MSSDRGNDLDGDPAGVDLLDALAGMWQDRDPVPEDLAERVSFVLSLENLEVEVLRLESSMLAGARGEEHVRTVTFTSDSLSVMVTVSPAADGAVRIDGWIAAGGDLGVELRAGQSCRPGRADEDGRFVFDAVPTGLVQLVFHPTQGAGTALRRPVVTPAMQV
jgi:hypothetical protein